MPNFTKHFLNPSQTHWVLLDQFGNKSKITLQTKSGSEVLRTVQFIEKCSSGERIQITYKGNRIFVTPDTILED